MHICRCYHADIIDVGRLFEEECRARSVDLKKQWKGERNKGRWSFLSDFFLHYSSQRPALIFWLSFLHEKLVKLALLSVETTQSFCIFCMNRGSFSQKPGHFPCYGKILLSYTKHNQPLLCKQQSSQYCTNNVCVPAVKQQ